MSALEDFRDCYGYLRSCCMGSDGEAVFPRVVACDHFKESENDGDNGAAVVQIDDGTWYCYEEWQDYTGHGCRCGCLVTGPFKTFDDAVRLGLGNDTRAVLGLELPQEVDGE